MKRIASALLTLTLAGFLCLPAWAASAPLAQPDSGNAGSPSEYTLCIDGADTDIDVCPMVPLRALAEQLGYTVTWSGGDTIRVDTGAVHTDVTLGLDRYVITTSLEGMVGMSAPFSLGLAPYACNCTTYVPLALFDALLGSQDAITVDGSVISIQTGASAQIPNPFVECDTLAQARQLAGFSLTLPADVQAAGISVLPGKMIQVRGDNGLSIRKALGQEDVSGDYNAYPQTETLPLQGTEITLKGTGDQVMIAVWTRGGYTYAIQSLAGLSREAVLTLAVGMD